MKIPFSYPSLLEEEYGKTSLIKTRHRGYITTLALGGELADRFQSPVQLLNHELGAYKVSPSLLCFVIVRVSIYLVSS